MIVERFASESDAYRKARQRLHEAEGELRRKRIEAASLRRELPLDTVVDDYVFEEGPSDLRLDEPTRSVRLSELFDDPRKPLMLYQFMYGGLQTRPCPMCTLWTDGFNGVAGHVHERANFAIVAQAPIDQLRKHARDRNWDALRFLSSSGSSFKSDMKTQAEDGSQLPAISVFVRDEDGSLRHFYTGAPQLEDSDEGGLDMLNPVWSLFDLIPEGRGDWYPRLRYGE